MIPVELMTIPEAACFREIEKIAKKNKLAENLTLCNQVVMVDLDSTLSDSRQRKEIVGQGWEAYAMASGDDLPLTATVALVNALSDNYSIHIVSGRHKSSQAITEAWLEKHIVYYDVLALSPDTEFHVEWKVLWRDYLEELGYIVLMLIDDHPVFRQAMAPTPVVIIDSDLY